MRENKFFLFARHRLPLYVNCDRQAFYVQLAWWFCNCFVPFVPFILTPNSTLFFCVFVNFIFFNSRWYYYVIIIMLFPWLVLTILLLQICNKYYSHTHTHTYTDEGIQFRNIFVWKNTCDFWCSQRSHTLKLVFLCMYINIYILKSTKL